MTRPRDCPPHRNAAGTLQGVRAAGALQGRVRFVRATRTYLSAPAPAPRTIASASEMICRDRPPDRASCTRADSPRKFLEAGAAARSTWRSSRCALLAVRGRSYPDPLLIFPSRRAPLTRARQGWQFSRMVEAEPHVSSSQEPSEMTQLHTHIILPRS